MGYDVAELRDIARKLALEAGELILASRPRDLAVAGTKSSPIDIVTEMDTASERLLRARLRELRPGDGVLGEEGGLEPGTTGLTWVADPIDGTVNYLYDLPFYSVSVAVMAGDVADGGARALAGCVHAPALGTTWLAAEGMGATRDGQVIRHTGDPDPSQALIATGFGYRTERKKAQGEVVSALIGEIRDIRRLGSAAIDLCLVADGRLDAHFERGLNLWDYAAGALIAREAGCVVTGLRGAEASPEMLVAGPARLAGWLAGRLAELGADRD